MTLPVCPWKVRYYTQKYVNIGKIFMFFYEYYTNYKH